MVWPWTLTFWPKNVIRSIVSQDAPVTKVWRKSVNRYWRYRGNIKLPRESRTHGRTHGQTTRKHIASAGAYRRRRLKKPLVTVVAMLWQLLVRERSALATIKVSRRVYLSGCLSVRVFKMLLLRQFLCDWADILTWWSPTLGKLVGHTDFWSGPCDVINDVINLAFQMAISWQRIVRSTSCLILW